jgi:hypothetical protein
LKARIWVLVRLRRSCVSKALICVASSACRPAVEITATWVLVKPWICSELNAAQSSVVRFAMVRVPSVPIWEEDSEGMIVAMAVS